MLSMWMSFYCCIHCECYHIAQIDFVLSNSTNNLRASRQFYMSTLNTPALFAAAENRSFRFDQPYFDRVNLVPTAVCVRFSPLVASSNCSQLFACRQAALHRWA